MRFPKKGTKSRAFLDAAASVQEATQSSTNAQFENLRGVPRQPHSYIEKKANLQVQRISKNC